MEKGIYYGVEDLKRDLAKAKLEIVDGQVKKIDEIEYQSRSQAIGKAWDALRTTKLRSQSLRGRLFNKSLKA
jgi:uncharacterized protein with FMN-binding domain